MGLNQTREVKTTYVCDFCKHQEVLVAEYSQEGFPQGWSVLALVPAEQKPKTEYMPTYSGFSYSREPVRFCLSSDREVSVALACPKCSVYGLQAVKLIKPEATPVVAEPVGLFKLTKKAFYGLVACSALVGAFAGLLCGILLKR